MTEKDASRSSTYEKARMLIAGELVPSESNVTFSSISPATLERVGDVPSGTEVDVSRAVRAAQDAAPGWRRMGMRERCDAFVELARRIRSRAAELADIEALDSGCTIGFARADIENSIRTIEYYTGIAWELNGDTHPDSRNGIHFTIREPHGVAACITAYNHALYFAIHRTIGALLAGNTLVLKPPEQNSLTSLMLAEEIADVFPRGVWNVVTGLGPAVGAPLVRHPAVRRVIFTGSAATGKLINRIAAESGLKSVALELGGKNPIVVFADADIEKAAATTVAGMNFRQTAGQSCMSNSRAFVHRSVWPEYRDRLVKDMETIRVGLPLDEDAEMGSLISEPQYEKVLDYINLGLEAGAELVIGGGRPPDPRLKGHYVAPTLFDNVDMGMQIAQEEIFGPVLAVLPWSDEDRLLADVNDVSYGLTAGIWTRDINKALRFAREIESGTVWINGRGDVPGMPHGGVKDSGLGRLNCMEDLVANTQQKSVNITIG